MHGRPKGNGIHTAATEATVDKERRFRLRSQNGAFDRYSIGLCNGCEVQLRQTIQYLTVNTPEPRGFTHGAGL